VSEPLPSIYVLVRDLVAIEPQQHGNQYVCTCTYCHAEIMPAPMDELTGRHKKRCAWLRAVTYMAGVERHLKMLDGPGLKALGQAKPTPAPVTAAGDTQPSLFDL